MGYRTLLLHVDSTVEGRSRLRNAVTLAGQLHAKLIGVCSKTSLSDDTGFAYEVIRRWNEENQRQAKEAFLEETGNLKDAAWYNIESDPIRALTGLACTADLVIGSRYLKVHELEFSADPGDLVLSVGLPVLLQPENADPLAAKRIVVAWKNIREARRAVSDALPFLKVAEEVTVVRSTKDVEDVSDGLEAVVERLGQHDIRATAVRRPRGASSVSEDLIAVAGEMGADLIVAGAYGHTRIREMILGGVTEGLLANCPTYVLFSH